MRRLNQAARSAPARERTAIPWAARGTLPGPRFRLPEANPGKPVECGGSGAGLESGELSFSLALGSNPDGAWAGPLLPAQEGAAGQSASENTA